MHHVAAMLSLAQQHHQTGNLRQSEQLCKQILRTDPVCADAHHLLGILACQGLGTLDEAKGHFHQALQCKPSFPEAWNNLGNVYLLQGDLNKAAAHYHEALRLQENYVDAYCNLGTVLLRQDKLVEASRWYRQALSLNPRSAEVSNNLGLALERQGQFDEASRYYRQALELNSQYADAWYNLGNVLLRQEKYDEASRCYRQALQINPGSAEAWNNLGLTLEQQQKLDEASSCFQQVLRLQPHYAEAFRNLGDVQLRQEKLEDAAASYRQALSNNPHYAEAHNGLGNALARQGNLEEASCCFRQALLFKPEFPDAYSNLGNALVCQNQIDEGLGCVQEALRLDPGFPSAHWNRSFVRLLRGDLEHGWPEYEWRWSMPGACPRLWAKPLWDGSPTPNSTILLHAEQGFGDTLQFIRYVPLVKERIGTVVVECQPALVQLLANAEGIDRLVARGSHLPPFDLQAPLLSLPRIFCTTLGSIPARVPYLQADAGLVKNWHHELRAELTFKVGIAWKGSPAYQMDRQRSIPLTYFERLARVPEVRLISLQKGPGTEQQSTLAGQFSILHLGPRLDPGSGAFVDTAAVMKTLDLVISSDTAVAHLAGALGVPVWVALALVPDWRWLLEREDCPWYPTMRLFRQTRPGHWNDVLDRIAEELEILIATRKG